jgi:hypothetical protein
VALTTHSHLAPRLKEEFSYTYITFWPFAAYSRVILPLPLLPTEYYSGDQSKNEMGRALSMYGGKERCIQGVGGKFEGNIPLGRPRLVREDNIKMNIN